MAELGTLALYQSLLGGVASREELTLRQEVCRRLIVSGLTISSAGALGSLTGLGWADVRAYGAVGDGITDDSAAFSSAIAAVDTGTLGGCVFVPPGSYVLATGLTLTRRGTRLCGVGRASNLLWQGGGSACVTMVGGETCVEDIAIEGTDVASEIGIDVASAGNISKLIRGVYTQVLRTHIRCQGGGAIDTVIRDCNLKLSGATGAIGIHVTNGAHSVTIHACQIRGNNVATDTTIGVKLVGTVGSRVTACNIELNPGGNVVIEDGGINATANYIGHNYFETKGASGVDVVLTGSVKTILDGNFHNSANGGPNTISFSATTAQPTILNSRFENGSGAYILNNGAAGMRAVALGNHTQSGTFWSSTTGVTLDLRGDGNESWVLNAFGVGTVPVPGEFRTTLSSRIAGAAATLGFHDVTPVTQQTVPLGSTTDTVITALQNLGLVKQA
jgi:hypothetical protein